MCGNVIKCMKIILSGNFFSSVIVTIANVKAMDRLCLNGQFLLIRTTTWRTPYFTFIFVMMIGFLSFAVIIGNLTTSEVVAITLISQSC